MSVASLRSIAPVEKQVLVNAEPLVAFAVFASQTGRWWPRGHSVGSSPQVDVVIEPRVGGRWYERCEDGSECDWGQVLVWAPGERLLLKWQLSADWVFDPNLDTEVDVKFVAQDEKTLVTLIHGKLEGYGKRADEVRGSLDSDGGWADIMARYADLVTST